MPDSPPVLHSGNDLLDSDALVTQVSATPQGVRDLLAEVCAMLTANDVCEDARSTVEIVLAEVLNNIVEHAYSDSGQGKIFLIHFLHDGVAYFRTADLGKSMPNEELPPGHPARLDVAVEDLPEGGFGWSLIRMLTQSLKYERRANRNTLLFSIDLNQPAA